MKAFFISFLISLPLFQCGEKFFSRDWWEHSAYYPEVLSRENFENSIDFQPIQPMERAGKIYLYKNYLFLGEEHKGFHIFDNTDNTNPQNIGFLKVLAGSDLSFKDDILYVNHAVDLVAMELDIAQKKVKIHKRIKDVFPQMSSPDGYILRNVKENDIVIGWNKK